MSALAASRAHYEERVASAAQLSVLHYLNPFAAIANINRHRGLIWLIARRDIEQRYRGSLLGLLWSFLTPIVTLAVYTFVFSVLFKARWSLGSEESRTDFALITFCGLIAFNVFSESVNRAPGAIVYNVNYVKKVIFPVEGLPLATVVSALVQAMISLAVLTVALLVFRQRIEWTVVLLPLALAPLVLFSAGFSMLLASLGVFLRDTAHVVSVVTPLLMFLSAVLYPVSALPESVRRFAIFNPLIPMVENFRASVVMGSVLDWESWAMTMIMGAVVWQLGYAWFMKTRRWFADVV